MGKTIGIIQARMRSERLPGKILAPLAGRPLLDLLYARIGRARLDEWWLATTEDPSDDVTEAWGFEMGLRIFRGHRADVLSRFVAISDETNADWVVRVTSDNPFLDAPVIDSLLDARDATSEAKQAEVVQHRSRMPLEEADADPDAPASLSPALPLGYGVQLVRASALERAAHEIPVDQFHHRVHVTSWLAGHARVHEVPTPRDWPDRPDWRWTVDTYEDLAMARSAFRLFEPRASQIDYPAMAATLDVHPEITALNAHIRQKRLEEG